MLKYHHGIKAILDVYRRKLKNIVYKISNCNILLEITGGTDVNINGSNNS